jgi:transcriptional regulator with XRE-family HTH domain
MAAKEIRLSRGLEQKTVAIALGMDPTYLSKLESGKRSSFLIDRLLRVYRFYGAEVTITWADNSGA